MRRWTWAFLAVAGVGLAIAFAILPIGGNRENRSSAHVSTGTAHLELDMNVTNGTGPCNPVDNTATHLAGSGNYLVAVCLSDSDYSPAGIQFQLLYDDTLNQCVTGTDPNSTKYDSNPDANLGSTTFGGTSLGSTNWDCIGAGGLNPPKCDANTTETGPGKGVATIACGAAVDPYALTVGAGVSSPIAMVTFNPLLAGTDTLSLNDVAIIDPDLVDVVRCNSLAGFAACFGGTDYKWLTPTPVPPTNTPLATATNTNTPTVTNTPTITNTPLPPTNTATATSTPTVTNTPLPPTATATPTVTNTPTITNTPLPPTNTATATSTPTVTNTPLPPTATNTATNTPLATATNTATATSTPTATQTPWVYIDAEGVCNPSFIHSSSAVTIGSTHDIAICVANLPDVITAFEFIVSYDADLNQCVDEECAENDSTCLDDMPDANAGDTTWGVDLGAGWDCEIEGEPYCGDQQFTDAVTDGVGSGLAHIWCSQTRALVGAEDLGDNETYGTLATIQFMALAAGTDDIEIENLALWGDDRIIGVCGAGFNAATRAFDMTCDGASINKERRVRRPTATPEPTATKEPPATATVAPTIAPPTATPTPLGGVGPQVLPPATGSGSTGNFAGAFTPWLIGFAAALLAAGSAFYLRFTGERRRER